MTQKLRDMTLHELLVEFATTRLLPSQRVKIYREILRRFKKRHREREWYRIQ